jgi:protein TonB
MILGILFAAGLAMNAGVEAPADSPAPPAEEHPVQRMHEPRLIRELPPIYPEAARHQGIKEATVVLQFLIDPYGKVKNPHVLQCSHPGLGFEAAAVKAVKHWRYEPGQLNGEPISVFKTTEVKFEVGAATR